MKVKEKKKDKIDLESGIEKLKYVFKVKKKKYY